MQERDVVIAHDQFRTYGGAERVAVEIARALDAPIYAMRVDPDVPPDDVEVVQLNGPAGGWLMRRHYMVQDVYQMLAWSHVERLHAADLVIETKTNPYWYVPRDTQPVLRYCHSTPRQLYDQFHRRGGSTWRNAVAIAQRALYSQVLPYADRWVANSDLVARRLEKYFGVERAGVVYPGVDTGGLGPGVAETERRVVYLGRLAINKRVPLIRETARLLDVPVHVAGDGPLEEELLDGAPDNLVFHGYVPEERKAELLSSASAALFLAENEDFGIVPVEAMASGTPVVGVDEGFTRHQVRDGANGVLCEPEAPAVAAAVESVLDDGVAWGEGRIADYAAQFAWERFREQIRTVAEQTIEGARVEADIAAPVPRVEGDD